MVIEAIFVIIDISK